MLNLGIIIDKNGKVVSHRSLIKILFNPVLLLFGLRIVSIFDDKRFKTIGIIKTNRENFKFNFKFNLHPGERIVKKRRII
jgi:hypothetical protein